MAWRSFICEMSPARNGNFLACIGYHYEINDAVPALELLQSDVKPNDTLSSRS